MPAEAPPDVANALVRLLSHARYRVRRGETDPVRDALDAVEALVTRALPPGDLRDRLLHGCAEADYLTGDDPLAAAEYCRAMIDLVVDSTSDELSDFDADDSNPDDFDIDDFDVDDFDESDVSGSDDTGTNGAEDGN